MESARQIQHPHCETSVSRRRPGSNTALDDAAGALHAQSRLSERRHVRAMAQRYDRARHLNIVLGWTVAIPSGGDLELTRRLIRALGHRLHGLITSTRPTPARRVRLTRIALFGECLNLKRQRKAEPGPPHDP